MQNNITTQTTGNSARAQQQAPVKAATAAYVVTPAIDVYESADEVRVLVNLPGVSAEAMALDLDKGVLTLTGARQTHARERAVTYKRRFSLPREIDAENVSAKLEDGVLLLTLPKRAAQKPRSIKVSGA